MKVINLWGSPGTGKSTTAAEVFAHLKRSGYKCELVCEVAKELVWEGRLDLLQGDSNGQYHIFSEQLRRLRRLTKFDLDFVISDSPLLLGAVYVQDSPISEEFRKIHFYEFSRFDNLNYMLKLRDDCSYETVGRVQSEIESSIIESKILKLFDVNEIPYKIVNHGNAVSNIQKDVNKLH